jgi:acyl-CoA thioesterase
MSIQRFIRAFQPSEPSFHFPDSCLQGRTMFGGVIAARLYQAIAAQVDKDRALRSFIVSFIGPVAPGPASVSSTCLRKGSAVSQWTAQLTQNQKVAATVQACFGRARDSTLDQIQKLQGSPTKPENCRLRPFVEGRSPDFTKFFEYRWDSGDFPFAGADSAAFSGWIRHQDWSSELELPGLIALMDAWPAPLLSLLKQPAPASSVTWMLTMPRPRPQVSGQDFLYYTARSNNFQNGYSDADAALWSPTGELIFKGRQLVAYYG